ncbi:uncharacterized protein BT62DRAFT_96304 [Guyanagaster necrorhizus]|uniref:F-box domain-containing protein n=1 Tax=Guyanagaster necrorhizus TaxID=856835 RepID=A0A9P7VU99_9AGAR|nr:uncharacterized protein BT62DRAFT_96304 [Guyanagaster necrorhizus MCA 3950]KAG7446987.1 hypothetical protein BT62DRAFT_96304 [Guyanagaster necrorhizus MCA 3950]
MLPSSGNTLPALADVEELKRSILDVLRDGSFLSEMILDELSLFRSQIPLYDAEILRVNSVLRTLRASKETIDECSRLHQSSLSPIRMLPAEVLAAIFEDACRATSAGSESEPVIPTVLSSVCSYWRKVCLSTRILWTHITAYHRIRPDNSSRIARRIDHYQSLSSPLSLTFHLTASYRKEDYDKTFPDGSRFASICDAIAVPSVLDRCHSIRFTMNSRGRLLFNAIKHQLPLLRSLEIKSVGSAGTTCPWAMCQNASNLDRLHIHGSVNAFRVQLPSRNQITTLFLSDTHSSMLKIFPKAIRATLVDCLYRASSSDKSVSLALESLTLTNTLLEPIISDPSVSFPRLSSLELVSRPHSNSAVPTFRDDLNNSLWQLCHGPNPSPITSLTLTEVSFTDAQVCRMLKCIPHLKHLSIVEANERRPNCSPIISEILVAYLYEQAKLENLKLVWAPSVLKVLSSLDDYRKENIVMNMVEHHAYTGLLNGTVETTKKAENPSNAVVEVNLKNDACFPL